MPKPSPLSRLVVLAVVLCVAVAGPVAAEEPPTGDEVPGTVYLPAFLDVDDDSTFAATIRSLAASRITLGCDPAQRFFCGEATVTRGQMAAFLSRGLDLPDPGAPVDFADATTSTFRNDIARLAAAGITRGCNPPDNDRFCPDVPVTRGQMAAFLVRALELDGDTPVDATNRFVDDDGSTFERDIDLLAGARITLGCNPPDNSRFCPEAPVTRAQMSAFLVRALDLPTVPTHPESVTVQRSVSENPMQSQLEVCPIAGDAIPELRVRNAAWGSVYPDMSLDHVPSGLTWSGGTYDDATDVWTTGPVSSCLTMVSTWDPGLVELLRPLTTLRITSPFGIRFHPIFGNRRMHRGVDFGAPSGTTVMAAAAGEVVTASYDGGYGNTVGIRHAGGLVTRYSHLSAITVRTGDTVSAGDTVGRVGCTGTCTGPHLHFETHEFGVPVNPMRYLDL